jgi:hypothetical protein
MFVLMVLFLLLGCLIVVPLMLIGLALRVAIGLALLPFKIAGLAIRLTVGLVIGLFGLILAGAMLLIPLLPIVAVICGIWLIVRLSRRQPAARLPTVS